LPAPLAGLVPVTAARPGRCRPARAPCRRSRCSALSWCRSAPGRAPCSAARDASPQGAVRGGVLDGAVADDVGKTVAVHVEESTTPSVEPLAFEMLSTLTPRDSPICVARLRRLTVGPCTTVLPVGTVRSSGPWRDALNEPGKMYSSSSAPPQSGTCGRFARLVRRAASPGREWDERNGHLLVAKLLGPAA